MTKYIVHVDVGDLPSVKSQEYVKSVSDSFKLKKNADEVFFLPNRKGYSSVETLVPENRYILFSSCNAEDIKVRQADLDAAFGENKIKVVHSSSRDSELAVILV